eukprot:6235525-Amphidinium_carterae.2
MATSAFGPWPFGPKAAVSGTVALMRSMLDWSWMRIDGAVAVGMLTQQASASLRQVGPANGGAGVGGVVAATVRKLKMSFPSASQ